jgi:hypothetical protein
MESGGQGGQHRRPQAGWFRRYVIGLGLGSAIAAYGAAALLTGRTFLPGYQVHSLLVHGRTGAALAAGYVSGGLYLVLRLFVEPRMTSRDRLRPLGMAQNGLLVVFIAALVYVLLHVTALT